MYASGKCKVNGPIEFAGTYSSNSVGYQLQTVIPARSMPMLVYRVVHGIERGTTTLISVKTNGTEYLLEPTKYRSFQRTSDTNMLRDELKGSRATCARRCVNPFGFGGGLLRGGRID